MMTSTTKTGRVPATVEQLLAGSSVTPITTPKSGSNPSGVSGQHHHVSSGIPTETLGPIMYGRLVSKDAAAAQKSQITSSEVGAIAGFKNSSMNTIRGFVAAIIAIFGGLVKTAIIKSNSNTTSEKGSRRGRHGKKGNKQASAKSQVNVLDAALASINLPEGVTLDTKITLAQFWDIVGFNAAMSPNSFGALFFNWARLGKINGRQISYFVNRLTSYMGNTGPKNAVPTIMIVVTNKIGDGKLAPKTVAFYSETKDGLVYIGTGDTSQASKYDVIALDVAKPVFNTVLASATSGKNIPYSALGINPTQIGIVARKAYNSRAKLERAMQLAQTNGNQAAVEALLPAVELYTQADDIVNSVCAQLNFGAPVATTTSSPTG